jgi:hypothetical protein
MDRYIHFADDHQTSQCQFLTKFSSSPNSRFSKKNLLLIYGENPPQQDVQSFKDPLTKKLEKHNEMAT